MHPRAGITKLSCDRAFALPAIFAVVGIGVAIGGLIVLHGELAAASVHGPAMAGGVIATLFGGLFGYLGIAALRQGGPHLLIDVPAGTIRYQASRRRGETLALDQLGPLEVVAPADPRLTTYRYWQVVYELRTERLRRALFRSARRELVEQRKAELEGFVLQAAIRRALSAPVGEGAMRSAPDDLDAVRSAAASDVARARDALSALQQDGDRDIAVRAAAVLARLSYAHAATHGGSIEVA